MDEDPTPPAGYAVRGATIDDAPVIAELLNVNTEAEIGIPWTTVEETRDDLTSPGHDPATDDALLLDETGRPVGCVQVFSDIPPHTEIISLVFVHPDDWGRGLSAFLIRLSESRARAKLGLAPAGERIVLHQIRFAHNAAAGRLLTSSGYRAVRAFRMMRIELTEPPPEPSIPPGIWIRPFERGRDESQVYAALSEGFRDHWGQIFPTFDLWMHSNIEGEGSGFDPSLWSVAEAEGEIVGALVCRERTARDPDTGTVEELAVRPAWRRRGLGLGLLHRAFGELHRRGVRRVELSVDAESQTGATRLYERAGMREAYAWEFWEKELRPAATD